MKIHFTSILAALFISGGFVSAATNDITALLQKGLFEEEANHNIEAAMRQYQAAIDGFDQDRQLAATAVFRLGECYRKLGKTNEAVVQYERVLRDFADQTALAGLSREYLAGKAPAATEVLTITAAATSAEDEEVRKIREMIRNSPDLINAPMNGGYTPLQSAAQSGNIAAAELLLANGADVNGAVPNNGPLSERPLSLAAERGNKGMIELLLAKGADVNAPDKNNEAQTPLYHAVHKGFKTAAEVLIAHKGDVNAHVPGGWTPLHTAASSGFSAVAELLIAHGADVNAADKNGNTPLFIAVRDSRPEVVHLLLASKADVNFTNSVGETPLFAAKNDNQSEVAKLLLAARADVNHRNKDGDTSLQIAARNKETELVKLLLANKADVNATTELGITPLLFAAANSDIDINLVKALLEAGADTQAHIKEGGGSWGNTIVSGIHALDLAISRGRPDEMELLLASHADANARFDSATPLHIAVGIGEPKSAEELDLLLHHGADPDLADQEGRTPLSRAVSKDDLKLVQLLLDHHADPNKPDNQGLPPLAYLQSPSPPPRPWLGIGAPVMPGNNYLSQMMPQINYVPQPTPIRIPPPGYPGQATQVNNSAEIKAALLKAGANEDFQRVARIFVAQKGSGSIGTQVFYKGTNSVNYYTLQEVVAEAWENRNIQPPVDYPDFAHVVINRLKAGGGKEEITVNLQEILTTGDCSKDVPLEWGDVVQIPQLDHLLNQEPSPLPDEDRKTLTKCLQRQVQIVVKGQTTKVRLIPPIAVDGTVRRAQAEGGGTLLVVLQSMANEGTTAGAPEVKTFYTFDLSAVVLKANVLLLSSDLRHVKVTRNATVMEFNLATPPSPDLRLRDGDIIEIPERDPNAPAAK